MEFFHPEDYLKEATDTFHLIEKRLKAILPLATVEHIGSSAITGALSKGDLDVFDYKIDVGIQLVALESEFEKIFSTFRDVMNKNPSLVKEYNNLKNKSGGLDSEDYRAIKSKFIEKILSQSGNKIS